MKKLILVCVISILFSFSVNAKCTDPSAYFDPEPEHITAPLSDMVFRGEESLNDFTPMPKFVIGEEERDLLAALIWHEAGNQDLYGKQLIAAVVFNRVNDPRFPNNITDVIFQKGQFTTANNLYNVSKNVTEECYEAIDLECAERSDTEILYFNCNSNVYGTFLYKYGDHWFAK